MKPLISAIIVLFTVQASIVAQNTDDSSALMTENGLSMSPTSNDSTSLSTEKTKEAAKEADDASKVKFFANIDMQFDKKMYDEQSSSWASNPNRSNRNAKVRNLRKAIDDFWMRVDFGGSYRFKFIESVFSLRFYPKWTKREMDGGNTSDFSFLSIFEIKQAYLKAIKDYSSNQLYFKIGRDGLLNSCSQLFGNYLDNPVGGYGPSGTENIIGPFLNKKVFANQIEVGATLNLFNVLLSKSSIMVGGNLNNDKWYSSPSPSLYERLDSDLNAGFFRFYQDFYMLNNRFHLGGGYRNYSTKIDSSGIIAERNYIDYAVTFDAVILTDMKFYTEFAYQRLGMRVDCEILRPINVGLTIPTGKVLDTLAVELENVGKTYFSDESMRDMVLARPTLALGWGIYAGKLFAKRFRVSWGMYTGDSCGDIKTSLRLSSYF